MIAYCGIDCGRCPRFRMTRFADRTGRRGLAEWLMRVMTFGRIRGEAYCDGCTAIDARMIQPCRECPARCCAMERGVTTCADCDRFGCGRLQFVWGHSGDATRIPNDVKGKNTVTAGLSTDCLDPLDTQTGHNILAA